MYCCTTESYLLLLWFVSSGNLVLLYLFGVLLNTSLSVHPVVRGLVLQ